MFSIECASLLPLMLTIPWMRKRSTIRHDSRAMDMMIQKTGMQYKPIPTQVVSAYIPRVYAVRTQRGVIVVGQVHAHSDMVRAAQDIQVIAHGVGQALHIPVIGSVGIINAPDDRRPTTAPPRPLVWAQQVHGDPAQFSLFLNSLGHQGNTIQDKAWENIPNAVDEVSPHALHHGRTLLSIGWMIGTIWGGTLIHLLTGTA